MRYKAVATTLFGMEKTAEFELSKLGIPKEKITDGKVYFSADDRDIARANINLRTVSRVSILLAEFDCKSFDDLYFNILKLDLRHYFNPRTAFPVSKAKSVSSRLTSVPALQRTVKKALVSNLKKTFGVSSLTEDQGQVPVNLLLVKDKAQLMIDTSGETLYKRGYRQKSAVSPVRETIASYMIMSSPWTASRAFCDPLCGSGTIAIEAAMIGMNMAAGVNRDFAGENYTFMDKSVWKAARNEALAGEKDMDFKIRASDINPLYIETARENAALAGVDHLIDFEVKDVEDLNIADKNGFVITNPPYGVRMEDIDMTELYRKMKKGFSKLDNWSYYIISADMEIGSKIGINFQKNRKIYNGGLKTYLFSYLAPKPKNI